MTKKEELKDILDFANRHGKKEIAECAKHQLELIERKMSKKQEKQKEEKEVLKVKIVELLMKNRFKEFLASDIAEVLKISVQKIIPILKELITENKIEKFTRIRGKTYCTLYWITPM